jgi:hypothetical protein
MAYVITFKNQAVDSAKTPITVPVGTVDSTSTSLSFTGKGSANHGLVQQTNLLRLLENFADTTAPSNPTVGQLWYDSTSLTLKVLVDSSPQTWRSLGGIQITNVGDAPPSPAALGDLWYERIGSASGFLYVFTGLGRYPTTDTTIGGWEQIYPTVTAYAGREEYDELFEALSVFLGPGSSNYGSGVLGRNIDNLTNFAALDADLRAKYATLPSDVNVLVSTASDLDITPQALSTTLFAHVDVNGQGQSYISAPFDSANAPSNGTILVDGVVTSLQHGPLVSSAPVAKAYIVYNQISSAYQIIRRNSADTGWEFDNGTGPSGWLPFAPQATHLVIGTMSSTNTFGVVPPYNVATTPSAKNIFLWAHAIPLFGVAKPEHLKVEPNSQDWDALLAAIKYGVSRLELPVGFADQISKYPFVFDGRRAEPSLLALPETDVRYPSAGRRSGREPGIVSQVQGFTSTANVLSTASSNRFSLKGINGSTGTYPNFAPTTVLVPWCSPPTAGLSAVLGANAGDARVSVRFRFATNEDRNRFIGSGGAIQIQITHTGGSTQADTDIAAWVAQNGVMRISGDKVRYFGSSLPLTMSAPSINRGLQNSRNGGTQIGLSTLGSVNVAIDYFPNGYKDFEFTIVISCLSGSTTGTTGVSLSVIRDTETYGGGDVYPAPLAFAPSDVTEPL